MDASTRSDPNAPAPAPGAVHRGGIVAVHAHPDDESITMGATLARYAASGTAVTLVTATLGEQGETMYGALDGLTADEADQLGGYRLTELARACRAMGVTDHRMLGGLGRFRDSGMAGTPSAGHPRAFIRAQQGGNLHPDAVAALAAILDEVRPRAVLTYDPTGGYGHPDHIAAHQVTVAAFEAYAASSASTGAVAPRLFAVVKPRSLVAAALETLWAAPIPARYARPEVDRLGTLVGDDEFDVEIPVGRWAAARREAMAAHATQLDVWRAGDQGAFALTNLYAQPLLAAEYFRVIAGPPLPRGARDLVGTPGDPAPDRDLDPATDPHTDPASEHLSRWKDDGGAVSA